MPLSEFNKSLVQPQLRSSTFGSPAKRFLSFVVTVAALAETSSIVPIHKATRSPRLLLAICIVAFMFLGALHSSQAAATSKNLIVDGSFEKVTCTSLDYNYSPPSTLPWFVGVVDYTVMPGWNMEEPGWKPDPRYPGIDVGVAHDPTCYQNSPHFGPTPYGNQFIELGMDELVWEPVSVFQTIKNLTPGATYKLSFAIASEVGCCAVATVSFPSGSDTPSEVFKAPPGNYNPNPYIQSLAGPPPYSTLDNYAHWGTKHMTFVAKQSSVTVKFTDDLRASMEAASYLYGGLWFTPNGGGYVGLDNVVVTPGTQLQLNATNGSDTESKDVESTPISATFPLGAKFSLALKKKSDGTAVASTYTRSNPSIQPAIAKPALFPKQSVLEFDPSTASDTKHFRAVHLGTETLTITPSDSSLSPATVNITINKPSSLGSSHQQYDATLVKLANRRGIPPQYLKGQIERETNFKPHSFRYEPFYDWRHISVEHILYDKSPYSLYRLATTTGLPRGADLIIPDDISPRNIYLIKDDTGTVRHIRDSDTEELAKNIYDNNTSQNWDKYATAERLSKDPTMLNFSAQTTISSSYGLLEIMYKTAVKAMQWDGLGGDKNPSYLFDCSNTHLGTSSSLCEDLPANLAEGRGSLVLATGYLVKKFKQVNSTLPSDPDTPNLLEAEFDRAFNGYNGSNIMTGTYGPTIVATYAPTFLPVPSTSIFSQ